MSSGRALRHRRRRERRPDSLYGKEREPERRRDRNAERSTSAPTERRRRSRGSSSPSLPGATATSATIRPTVGADHVRGGAVPAGGGVPAAVGRGGGYLAARWAP